MKSIKFPHQRLADALRDAGLTEMAEAADTHRYHDFLSRLPEPSQTLTRDLIMARKACHSHVQGLAIEAILRKHVQGVWDARPEEAMQRLGPEHIRHGGRSYVTQPATR